MKKTDKIDWSKLLGFDTVSDRISSKIDFRDETIGARLGAKVGDKGLAALDLPFRHARAAAKHR